MNIINSNDEVLISNDNLPRLSSGYTKIEVEVDCDNNQFDTATGSATNDSPDRRKDIGLLFLPTTYSTSGTPTRLIIWCHGMWDSITESTSSLNQPVSDLVKLGYAVLGMNGIPADYYTEVTGDSTTANVGDHFGSQLALQSYSKAYQYVVKNYNLYKECFICGLSMGGLTALMLSQQNNIPVLANAIFSPVTDHFKQMFPLDATKCGQIFDFDAKGSLTDSEWYLDNIEKTYGLNPMIHNTNWKDIDLYGSSPDYTQLIKYDEVPLKAWHSSADGIVNYQYTKYLVDAIRKGGGLAYYREFSGGGHDSWYYGDTITMKDVNNNSFTTKTSVFELYNWLKLWEN